MAEELFFERLTKLAAARSPNASLVVSKPVIRQKAEQDKTFQAKFSQLSTEVSEFVSIVNSKADLKGNSFVVSPPQQQASISIKLYVVFHDATTPNLVASKRPTFVVEGLYHAKKVRFYTSNSADDYPPMLVDATLGFFTDIRQIASHPIQKALEKFMASCLSAG